MSDQHDSTRPVPATKAEDAVLALYEEGSLTPWLDAHGFDPKAYDWYPVLRRPRADGWTPPKQRLFIETLADTASPKQAASAVGMSLSSAYKLRRSPGGEAFAAAWDAAIQHASKRLVDIAYERAVDGVEEAIRDAEGNVIGHKTRYNDRLLMFLLRAHQPDRYRHAAKEVRAAHEPPPPALPPVAEAVRLMEPAPPERPEEQMEPEELNARITVADLNEGDLPSWHRPTPPPDPEPTPQEEEMRRKIDQMLDEVRQKENPGWNAEAVQAFIDDEDERPSRRARRRARGRSR